MKYYVILVALALGACAQPVYLLYDLGIQRPNQEICWSQGHQILDVATLQCVTPPPTPPPTPEQAAASREHSECISAASLKYKSKADGVVASYAIFQSEVKQCGDLMASRFVARQQMKGADCSLKLDWILRYRMMVYGFEQKAMAEDRYAEICGKVRRD
jgi:hypothetical protein